MSQMLSEDFTANGTAVNDVQGESLIIMVTGTFGSGTLAVKLWSDARSEYRTIAAFTAATTSAQELYIGAGQRFQFEVTGATSPAIEIDYWFV